MYLYFRIDPDILLLGIRYDNYKRVNFLDEKSGKTSQFSDLSWSNCSAEIPCCTARKFISKANLGAEICEYRHSQLGFRLGREILEGDLQGALRYTPTHSAQPPFFFRPIIGRISEKTMQGVARNMPPTSPQSRAQTFAKSPWTNHCSGVGS